MHPVGAIVTIAAILKSSTVTCVADMNQIPFASRIPTFTFNYLKLTSFMSISKILSTSYRCPAHIAAVLNPLYRKLNSLHDYDMGMNTTNDTIRSLSFQQISVVDDVP